MIDIVVDSVCGPAFIVHRIGSHRGNKATLPKEVRGRLGYPRVLKEGMGPAGFRPRGSAYRTCVPALGLLRNRRPLAV